MSSAQLRKFASVKPAEIEWRNELPFSIEFGDVYFSVHGAIEESQHVFIEGNQLVHDWKNSEQNTFYITELGFGSGLNFLNTAKQWQQSLKQSQSNKRKHLHYIAIEKRPFSFNDLTKTYQLWPSLAKFSSQLIRLYPSQTYGKHQLHFKKWNLTLTLMLMPVEDAFDDLIKESAAQQNKIEIDHWFLDGFAPSKNSSMWGKNNALNIKKLSKVGSKLATYSVAGSVKHALIDVGFKIIKKKGFAKKREMLTAILTKSNSDSHLPKFINLKYENPWFHVSKNNIGKNLVKEKIAIIGGGIAGCATAYTLSQKGFSCEIFEQEENISTGASGAAAGIFHPQLTNDMNIGSQFNWLSYLELLRFLIDLNDKEKSNVILSQGIERFLKSETIAKQLLNLSRSIGIEHWLRKSKRFKNNKKCISFPHAAAVSMSTFCQLLIDKIPEKLLYLNTNVRSIHYENEHWVLSTENKQKLFKQVVFCGGAKSNLLKKLNITSTNVTRGQTCYFQSKKLAQKITTTLCEKSYLVPRNNNLFHLGTTFDNFEDQQLNKKSQNDMLTRASSFLKSIELPFLSVAEIESTELKGTIGYRLHSYDRMPIVGAAVNQSKLIDDFYHMGQMRLLRESITHYNLPGLWLNTAYGSHGLLYGLLASQHLSSLITNDVSPLQYQMSNALHPARFIIRELKST